MKVFFVISAIVSMVSAGVGPIVIIPSTSALIRSPQHDSTIIQSERLGGNFAYAIAEGQSFQTVSPILASNIRAIDKLGVSYAINPFPILTAPTNFRGTFLLHQSTTEEEQREQQKQKDLLQKQRDELQEAFDATQQAIERQREDEERKFRDHIDQHNEAIEQQKQLILLQHQWQQDQQSLLTSGIVTLPIVPVAPGSSIIRPIGPVSPIGPVNPVNINDDINGTNNNNDNNNSNQQGTDLNASNDSDSVIVENPTLSMDSNSDDQTRSAENQPNDDQSTDNN